jgi:hypothetical protein
MANLLQCLRSERDLFAQLEEQCAAQAVALEKFDLMTIERCRNTLDATLSALHRAQTQTAHAMDSLAAQHGLIADGLSLDTLTKRLPREQAELVVRESAPLRRAALGVRDATRAAALRAMVGKGTLADLTRALRRGERREAATLYDARARKHAPEARPATDMKILG